VAVNSSVKRSDKELRDALLSQLGPIIGEQVSRIGMKYQGKSVSYTVRPASDRPSNAQHRPAHSSLIRFRPMRGAVPFTEPSGS
jgi:hypothetical protein